MSSGALGAWRHETRPLYQHGARPGRRVIARDLGSLPAASARRRPFDDGVGRAVGQPARRPEARRLIRFFREDAVDLLVESARGVSLLRVGNGAGHHDGSDRQPVEPTLVA